MSSLRTASTDEALIGAGAAEALPVTVQRRRELVFAAVATGILLLDQLTKGLAVQHLWPVGSVSVAGILRLSYVENRGAAFGVLQNQTIFFVAVGIVVIAGLALSCRRLVNVPLLLSVCLGMQLGGALGNLIDRLRQGYVVDFVDFGWWPVFNVADAAIVVGVCGMAYYLVRGPSSRGAIADA